METAIDNNLQFADVPQVFLCIY